MVDMEGSLLIELDSWFRTNGFLVLYHSHTH